jgi:hypothetical protein
MSSQEDLSKYFISISTSESPDMPVLGLSPEHLQDAMAEISRHLLALGARLAYGGDLRSNGFTELLFELVARHRRDIDDAENGASATNFLAWPVHIRLTVEELQSFANDLEGSAKLTLLTIDGSCLTQSERERMMQVEPTDEQWGAGLRAMRYLMCNATDARVILGGRVEGYKGTMPGIAEEALLSLEAARPLFIVGGFGGCARAIAESLGLVSPWSAFPLEWQGREVFGKYSAADLNNGLTEIESATLAQTAHIDQAITLILTGLLRIRQAQCN